MALGKRWMSMQIRVSYMVSVLFSVTRTPGMKTVRALGEGVDRHPSGGGPVSGASLIIIVGWESYVGISIVDT